MMKRVLTLLRDSGQGALLDPLKRKLSINLKLVTESVSKSSSSCLLGSMISSSRLVSCQKSVAGVIEGPPFWNNFISLGSSWTIGKPSLRRGKDFNGCLYCCMGPIRYYSPSSKQRKKLDKKSKTEDKTETKKLRGSPSQLNEAGNKKSIKKSLTEAIEITEFQQFPTLPHSASQQSNVTIVAPTTNKKAKWRGSTVRRTFIDEMGSVMKGEQRESFPITAYALCDEFDLKGLHKGLLIQDLYIPTVLTGDLSDVIHVTAKYPIDNETREIFFFRDGAVVFWNVPYLEQLNVFRFLKEYEEESYSPDEVEREREYMHYSHSEQNTTRLLRGKVILGPDSQNKVLERYAFSNALASSVKLGIWECTLEKFVDGIEHISEELKSGKDVNLTRGEVLQKTGEIFTLRHRLKLTSDLLDIPDFYWERERLATLYQQTCDHLSLNRRTKVMNDKLTECCELLDHISGHLTDQHHTRLEVMIIVLIMIEVGFEILHLLERYEYVHI